MTRRSPVTSAMDAMLRRLFEPGEYSAVPRGCRSGNKQLFRQGKLRTFVPTSLVDCHHAPGVGRLAIFPRVGARRRRRGFRDAEATRTAVGDSGDSARVLCREWRGGGM